MVFAQFITKSLLALTEVLIGLMTLDFYVIQATLLLGSHRHCKLARLVYELWLVS